MEFPFNTEKSHLRPPDFAYASTRRKSPLEQSKIAEKTRLQAIRFNGSQVVSHGLLGLLGFLGLRVAGSSSLVPSELLNRRILVLAADHGGSGSLGSGSDSISHSRSLCLSLGISLSLSLSLPISTFLSLYLTLSLDLFHSFSVAVSVCVRREAGEMKKEEDEEMRERRK
jgi:hypothetical protein